MADITNHLNTIINAIHGEDVRQAIHDAIEACYTDDRPGGADLKARQQINQILANIIGSNTYEETLYTGEIFIGGNDQNPVNITVTPHPGQYPYVLVYFKTIQSAVPEIRMFKGTDFETGPITITSPFLESDGTRASIREFHIKRKSGGLNTEYQLYYTYSWILDGTSATDNGHDVGTRRTLTNADEDKALILCKITGFNPVSDSAQQIAEQLQLLMDFRDSVVTTETTTVATGTASGPAGSSSTYVDITLSAALPYNKDLKITVTSDTAQTGKSAVQVRSNVGAQAQIGELFSGETSGEFSYSPVGTEFTKVRILSPTVGATYSATVEQIEETYNSHIATEEYVDNEIDDLRSEISQNTGFPTEAKTALLEFLRLVAVTSPSASRYYDALEEALDTTVEVPLYTFDTGTVTQNSGKRNLTVDGNHFIFTNNSASTSGTGYYGDISHVARNTSAGTSNSIYSGGTKLFTVPAGATVKITITPISVQCLDSKLWNVVPYGSDGAAISSAISAFTPSQTEPSTTTFIVENAFDVCCFGTFIANSYSKVEASVKMYVNGVRYI